MGGKKLEFHPFMLCLGSGDILWSFNRLPIINMLYVLISNQKEEEHFSCPQSTTYYFIICRFWIFFFNLYNTGVLKFLIKLNLTSERIKKKNPSHPTSWHEVNSVSYVKLVDSVAERTFSLAHQEKNMADHVFKKLRANK